MLLSPRTTDTVPGVAEAVEVATDTAPADIVPVMMMPRLLPSLLLLTRPPITDMADMEAAADTAEVMVAMPSPTLQPSPPAQTPLLMVAAEDTAATAVAVTAEEVMTPR